jgi:hypothetical protein
MKGIVFAEFFELVDNTFGYEMIDKIIEKAALPHNGIYVSGGTYPHSEMFALVNALSEETGVASSELLITYGKYLFGRLMKLYPHLAEGKRNPIEFMASVDSYIHVEVRKLHPGAELPQFITVEHNEDSLIMDYISSRKMEDFGVGLMRGCEEFFKVPIDIRYERIEAADKHSSRFYVKLI